jgi:demethylmenaquinone methyltransferase/2-methoxy-6-polyprenyl-1,4-benzoquinol methylase
MKTSTSKDTASISNIFNSIAKTYDLLNTIFSFGLDRYWRSKPLQFIPEKTELKVLDLACGSCKQILTLAKKRPYCTFTGVDISLNLLEIGRKNLLKNNISFDTLLHRSALDLPFQSPSFDLITLSFGIRNMDNIDKALKEAFRVLKKEGKIFILEFSTPTGFFQKKLSFFYLKMILPKIGNLISNHSYAYTYLNQTIQEFPFGEGFLKYMKEAGFENTHFYPMTFGIVTLYVGEKP